jgi:phosphatidylinositol alpha-1,6-mannosyltransferase
LDEGPLVLSLSRLIPRKGFDRTIEAVAGLRDEFPDIQLAIAGSGRDAKRLARIARRFDFPVTFLGRVSEPDLPSVFGIADVFSMPCRNRWGGLEQEGFGIVFLEAASCGVPQIAGLSGGAPEAVIDGISGLVVQQPNNSDNVANAIRSILGNLDVAERMSKESRNRAVSDLSYDLLAQRLERALS